MAITSLRLLCRPVRAADGYLRLEIQNPRAAARCINAARLFTENSAVYPLPWPQFSAPMYSKEPVWNKWAGLFLLRRVIKQRTGQPFAVSEFFLGVKEAILALSNALQRSDRRGELSGFLHPSILIAIQRSLSLVPEGFQIELDVENVRNMELVAVNSTVGTAPLGDEHVISWLGQKIIASKSNLDDIMKAEQGRFTFEKARQLGREAAYNRLEFQLIVSFVTKERFALLDNNGHIVRGSKDSQESHHLWKFTSILDWDSEYPFQWTIMDINNFLLQLIN